MQKTNTGVYYIGAGVAVFIVCSIIQGLAGSSMFSNYYTSTGFVLDLLVNVTFRPGWLATVGLIATGVFYLYQNRNK